MNKIEKSIVDSLNGVTNKVTNWKLFTSRYVSSEFELKTDKEKKFYSVLCDFLRDKDTTITMLPISKFTTMFIDWNNEKVIENVSSLIDIKLIEKCLKMYFLEFHLELNRYFCLASNNSENDNNIYIVSVCRESGIYQIKDKTEKSGTAENDNQALLLAKISNLLNSVVSLSSELDNTIKTDIVKSFSDLMLPSANTENVQLVKNA